MSQAIKEKVLIKLNAYINEDDQLVVSYNKPRLQPITLRPEGGLMELVKEYPTELTVEVHDFVQRGTVYEVYGATLEDDGRTIASHWTTTGAGQTCSFMLASSDEASKITFFIGALPRRKDAPVPAPLWPRSASGSGCGSFPTDIEPERHGA